MEMRTPACTRSISSMLYALAARAAPRLSAGTCRAGGPASPAALLKVARPYHTRNLQTAWNRPITPFGSIPRRFPAAPCGVSTPASLPLQTRSESTWGRRKVASKRKEKKYKLKNHGGAVARWMVSGDGMFKRAQAGRRHLNRKMRVWKRKSKKRRVLATTTQKKLLRKLMPYWKKHYMR